MASAQEVICEHCCLPSHVKLGAAGFVLNTGSAIGTDAVDGSESTYVGGMSLKSVDGELVAVGISITASTVDPLMDVLG